MVNSLKEKGKAILNILKPHARLGLVSAILLGAGAIFALFVYGAPVLAIDWGIGQSIAGAFGNILLWIASKFNELTVFIMHFVVELGSYNNYINSQSVVLGWVLVRDVTNMFFVIILMVIAFGTVLGVEQYEWKKMLVKFVLAAILVNFSRVICGVIIDAAQVFMMTFISGVAAVAGGNLMNALALGDIMNLAKDSSIDPNCVADIGNIVASAVIIMIFSFAAMVIIGAYLVVLIGRIVALWVLVILSPLAFVLGIIPKFQSYAGEWWTQFTNNVMSGPVLAFFLWLAFAVAGGGNIHSTEFGGSNVGYPLSDVEAEKQAVGRTSESAGCNMNQILESETLASFIIAAALLLAGVKVTQRLAGVGAGVLGAAAGAVTKFATVAGGVAAARWAVGAAGAAAKKTGKFALMKAPLVGGEAWMRTGRRVKARAQLAIGGFQKGREALVAGIYKKAKGVEGPLKGLAMAGAGLAGGVLATGKQKERRVKFLEGAVESLDKEREESLGMGTLPEGLLSGKRLKSYELAKKKADEDKDIGLMIPLEQLLRDQGRKAEADTVASKRAQMEVDRQVREAGSMQQLRENIASGKSKFDLDKTMKLAQAQVVRDEDLRIEKQSAEYEARARHLEEAGRHDTAQLVRGQGAAVENKRLNELYGSLDTSDLKAMFQNLINRRDDIVKQLTNAYSTNNTAQAAQLEDKLALEARKIHNFKTNTMGNEFVRQFISEAGAKNNNGANTFYSGTNSIADRKKLEMSVLTGLDAGTNQATVEKIIQKMEQSPGMQEEYKRRDEAANRVVASTGDMREAVIMDKGMVADPATGRYRIVRGMAKNVGTHALDGSQHPAGTRPQLLEVDRKQVDYYTSEKANFAALTNPDVIFSVKTATATQPQQVDLDQLNAIGSNLATKNRMNVKSALPHKIVKAWNEMATSGQLTQGNAANVINSLMGQVKDRDTKRAIWDMLGDVAQLSGVEKPS